MEKDKSNSPTDKSLKNSYCSECSKLPLCPVISSIDNTILFVEYDINLHCNNAMSFGFSYICKCQERLIHYKLFKK
jgi:hypothetical protein